MNFPEKPYEGPDWIVAIWPDGTWCNKEDIYQYTWMSDDYELHKVLSYDEGYSPVKTERLPCKSAETVLSPHA